MHKRSGKIKNDFAYPLFKQCSFWIGLDRKCDCYCGNGNKLCVVCSFTFRICYRGMLKNVFLRKIDESRLGNIMQGTIEAHARKDAI